MKIELQNKIFTVIKETLRRAFHDGAKYAHVKKSESLDRFSRAQLVDKASQGYFPWRVFSHLYKLQNYKAAAEVGMILPESPVIRRQLLLIRSMLASIYGKQADLLLDHLVASNRLLKMQTSEHLYLLDTLHMTSWDKAKQQTLINNIRNINLNQLSSGHPFFQKLRYIEYRIKSKSDLSIDPINFFGSSEIDYTQLDLVVRYIAPLLSFGHQKKAYEIIEEITKKHGLLHPKVFLLNLQYRAEWTQENLGQIGDIPQDLLAQTQCLRTLSSLSGESTFMQELFYRKVACIEDALRNGGIFQKSICLKEVLSSNYSLIFQQLTREIRLPDTVLPQWTLQGYNYFERGRFDLAHQSFLEVLKQNPGDGSASAGLRLTALRIGTDSQEILNIRKRIGYGVATSGSASINKNSNDYILSRLFCGSYAEGLYAKRNAPHWQTLKQIYQQRFLLYERFPKDLASSTVFLIADEGVSDEVRTAQFYNALASLSKELIATCDPRLLPLFTRSFPNISFIPTPRIRPGALSKQYDGPERIRGFGGKIAHYLTENTRELIDDASYVTFGQNLFFNYFIGELHSAKAEYLLPKTRDWQIVKSDKLRVGILWRSHMISGQPPDVRIDVASNICV